MRIQELKLREYPYKCRRGLAERLARQHFERQGYEVFRGGMVLGRNNSFYYELYENVRAKYDRLEAILSGRLGLRLWLLRQELGDGTGLPDLFMHSPRKTFFAEIKLEHESLKAHQQRVICLLEGYGFEVRVLRFKSKPYRIESQLISGETPCIKPLVLVRQKRFRRA